MIRLFLFDKGAPDPMTDWPMFASYIQAVLDAENPDQIVKLPLNGSICFAGHGVAMLTTENLDP
jgi:hypothetical protein